VCVCYLLETGAFFSLSTCFLVETTDRAVAYREDLMVFEEFDKLRLSKERV